MTPLTLFSFAKINLLLRVLRKRTDGYHDIETIMQTVDLFDALTFSSLPSGTAITCTDSAVPTDHRNLAHQAITLMRRRSGRQDGIRIDIDKRIPVAAGLAGGSGNAAMTLHALNRIWALGLKEKDLLELAAELGSDVPFCLFGGTAAGEGRGERLTWIDTTCRACFVLVNPPCVVSSAWAYQNVNLELTNVISCINLKVSVWQEGDFKQWISLLHNDLEPAVRSAYPMVEQISGALRSCGAAGVLMSGSGPTVFGVFPDRVAAETARQQLVQRLDPQCRVLVAPPISRAEIAARCELMAK